MSDAGGHSRPLAELRVADAATFGGKSASLGELIAAGIPVPPGFALSTTGFGAFVEEAGLAGRISSAVSDLSPADLDRVNAVSSAISEGMRSAPVPESVRAEVARRYAELAGDADPPVAVRSSALGEDSQDATFAGQQETYLWVRGGRRLRRRPRLLGEPLQPAGDDLSCARRSRRSSARDGRHGSADG